MQRTKLFKNSLPFALIIILFLLFRSFELGTDISNSDSARWHRRSERFLTALKQKDYKSTYQHYQPGVTLMWLNSFVKQIDFTNQLKTTNNPLTLEHSEHFVVIHKYSKLTLVFILAMLLFLQMHLIAKTFSPTIAALYGIIMSFEPYLIGIDRWFHLTSLETYFGMTSFLFLILWINKFKDNFNNKNNNMLSKGTKSLITSAVFFALAVFSKLTSLLLAPVLGLIILHTFFTKTSPKKLKNLFIVTTIFTLTTLVTFFVLLPALVVESSFVLYKFKDAIFNAVSGDIRGEQITGITSSFYYVLVLIFKLSPIALALFIGLGFYIKKIAKVKNVGYVLLYFLVFFTALTVADKKIDRYVIIIYPSLVLLLSVFVSTFNKKFALTTISLYVLFSIWIVVNYKPIYSAYYSPIFGANAQNKALKLNIYDNSGEYYAQAADYLNSQGRDKKTWIPHNIESFSYFYNGNLQRHFSDQTNYLVTSINHLNANEKGVYQYLNYDSYSQIIPHTCNKLEKVFGNKQANVVFVFSCN